MISINYKHLHYFLQVAESGSVAAASRQLHLTPQTISSQVQLLADRLGGELFEKVGRRLALTETGQLPCEKRRARGERSSSGSASPTRCRNPSPTTSSSRP
jgi:DNA-binding transcriptional LysR family regulator